MTAVRGEKAGWAKAAATFRPRSTAWNAGTERSRTASSFATLMLQSVGQRLARLNKSRYVRANWNPRTPWQRRWPADPSSRG